MTKAPAKITTFFVETTGCQMNKLDTELIEGALAAGGLRPVDRPESADVALLNTCSVREHAEAKALSRLGHWQHLRKKTGRPLVIAMVGCFAQRDPQAIRKAAPFIDILCGPGRLHDLPDLIAQFDGERAVVAVDDFKALRAGRDDVNEAQEEFDTCRPIRTDQRQAYVRVQRGCDKFCTYCVVPYVRGPECSRPAAHILAEVKRLDDAGCQEVTLLGQTISSYQSHHEGQTIGLAELLTKVHQITAIPRIRFITSYPGDFPLEIFRAMAELERICPYLHLPAQHGSNRILQLMNRRYTFEHYLELIEQGKKIVPGISIAGDFIVGFPGETDEDHEASVRLLRTVRYKNCFIFKYSPRPATLAARRFNDDVADDVRTARLRQLLDEQDRIAGEDNRLLIGRTLHVLVEGPSKKSRSGGDPLQLTARTADDRIVVFEGSRELIGRIVPVGIQNASALTLFGEYQNDPRRPYLS